MNSDEHLNSAERQISEVLARLEKDTWSLVRSIEIIDLDVTKMEDERAQLYRSVRIVTERLPGTKWG